MNEWWSVETGTLLGAFGGAAVGLLGAAFGVAAGTLVPRGIGRRAMTGAHGAIVAIGVVLLLGGIYAVAIGAQPYHVYFPLLLCGFIMTAVFAPLLPVIRARYRQADARRMEAAELRRA